MLDKAEMAALVLDVLQSRYPHARPHLAHRSAWELLAATILSAQCTDERVNRITPELFRRLPDPAAFAAAAVEEVEELIRSAGFYHNKARSLIAAAGGIMRDFGGEVPSRMEDLLRLDGVGRKTANVVLSGAFGLNEGLAVDTHVARISRRLGLTAAADAREIEADLLPLFPRREWGGVNHRMVSFGREVCKARKPLCADCPLGVPCPRL
ncbi:MAG: endonuclease III [Deltaproteobacteria bacterium]|jgi:endonuclease-3|nr:endonuclease III [Deltaproteobacteria bacterium]